jgi:hypothetical protein
MSNDTAGFASATDRSIAYPTEGFDAGIRPDPFQTKPPACYPAYY